MTFLEKQDSIYYFSKNPYPLILDSFDPVRNDSLLKDLAIKKKAESKNFYHKVKRGETLYYLARKYRVSVGDIKRWNHRTTSNLQVGERILIKRKV
jgi:LysM repeat protein